MNEKREKQLTTDEELLMCAAYRYAIGRKTYISTLAPYIGQKYYPLLSDERAEFNAMDIRRSIRDCLMFNTPSFEYDGTVMDKERNALSDYLTWINGNVDDKEDLQGIQKIVCYKDIYKDDAPKKFDVVRGMRKTRECFESDFSDLLEWETLASLFDRKNHKFVHAVRKNKCDIIRCFYAWEKELVPTNEKKREYIVYAHVPWKYKRVLKGVDNYLELGNRSGHVIEDLIVKIEDV